jgi:hypothetical protein
VAKIRGGYSSFVVRIERKAELEMQKKYAEGGAL